MSIVHPSTSKTFLLRVFSSRVKKVIGAQHQTRQSTKNHLHEGRQTLTFLELRLFKRGCKSHYGSHSKIGCKHHTQCAQPGIRSRVTRSSTCAGGFLVGSTPTLVLHVVRRLRWAPSRDSSSMRFFASFQGIKFTRGSQERHHPPTRVTAGDIGFRSNSEIFDGERE